MQKTNLLIEKLEQTSTRQRDWMRSQGVDVDKILREVYGSDLQTLPEPRNLKSTNFQYSDSLFSLWFFLRIIKSLWMDHLEPRLRGRK
jgi:hypothetical protein